MIPQRPAIQYYGSKWLLYPWISKFFPKHDNYIDVCGGSAAILLQKEPSQLEVYNDIDDDVNNFFRVMRDNFDELIRRIELTPWSRNEYISCKTRSGDPIEDARRFFVSSHMSMSSMSFEKSTGWRHLSRRGERFKTFQESFDDTKAGLYDIANRLLHVQIEGLDARKIIAKYDDSESILYFDPPYIKSTRVAKEQYAKEVDETFHIESAELLRSARGYAVVSGYACDLYTDLYEKHGWQRFDKESQVNGGAKRIESIWLSPRTANAISGSHSELPLFAQ